MTCWSLLLSLLLANSMADPLLEGEFGSGRKGEQPRKEKREEPAPGPKKESSVRKYPYHGTIESADANGGSITLKGKAKPRIIIVSVETRITRNERKASLGEVMPGEAVSGSVVKTADGKEKAVTLRLKGNGEPGQKRR